MLRVTRLSQALVAAIVAACIIFLEFVTYGPDIDGRTPPLADTVQMIAIEALTVGAFTAAAIALFRWYKFGWWLSVVLDGLLGTLALAGVVGDFKDRFMVTREGREALWGDLTLHSLILLACIVVIGFLITIRHRLLSLKIDVVTKPASTK